MSYVVTGYNPGRIYENIGGTWGYWKNFYINQLGTWYRVTRFHTNIDKGLGEEWTNSVSWNPALVELTVTGNQDQLDLYSIIDAGTSLDLTKPVNIQLFVPSAYTVYSSDLLKAAVYSSTPLAAGSIMGITNQGRIYGSNGEGGVGGSAFLSTPIAPTVGSQGGAAISLPCDTTIDNGTGYIFGGGGGGGGGGLGRIEGGGFDNEWLAGGGGGGNPGGAGGVTAEGRNGGAGSSQFYQPAVGGAGFYWDPNEYGGQGGSCNGAGEVGGTGAFGLDKGTPYFGATGGAVGSSVVEGAFSVSFTSGNDSTHLKGPIT